MDIDKKLVSQYYKMPGVEAIKIINEAFQKHTAMYQNRSEDLDPRITKIIQEGPWIKDALENIEGDLKQFYELKEAGFDTVRFFTKGSQSPTYIYEGDFPADWDYTKEMVESLEKLNQVCLDAYIVFLECEREALIERWNAMAKDLKPKK